jgi:4,5-dihydroxyphthalate decarboxylase
MDLRFPTMRYDHTMPLLEGRVEIPDVTIKPEPTPTMVVHDVPSLHTGDFGLCDLNTGYWLSAIEAGWELIGLPLFIKRKGVYQYIWVRNGIEKPRDLEGKTMGTGFYPTGITILIQGLLQNRHGVDMSTMTWLANGMVDAFPITGDSPRVVVAEGPRKTAWDRLLDGEVDAIAADISDGEAWERLEASPDVHQLFDYMGEDRKLYEETGIYTPMHLIVMSKKLDRDNPGLARKIYDAFDEAKSLAYKDIRNDRAGFSVVYLRERLAEQAKQWGDPWKYGVSANHYTVETFAKYNAQQGITTRELAVEELFAAGTLDT